VSAAERRKPRLSIVIATYNRREMLARALPSFFAQEYPPSDYELVLAVDGSTDGTAEYLRCLRPDCALEVIEQKNRGPAAARNAGVAAASGEVVLFMDDDIRVTPGLVAAHAEHHASNGRARVQGAIFAAPESPPTLPAFATREWYERYDAALRAADRKHLGWRPYLNANSSIAVELFRELGGFDEAIPFPREDFELALRMSRAGIPSVYVPDAVAFEIFAKSSRSFVRDAVGFGRAEVAICRKHPHYPPDSALAPADRPRPAPLRTTIRGVVPRLPRGSHRLLDPAVDALEALSSRPRPRRLGMRLLEIQHRMVLLRTAARELGSAREFVERFDRRLPALLYHRVGPGLAGLHPSLSIEPAAFERQIDWLARRGFTAIRAQDWIGWRQGRGELAHRPILITFDDAYAEIGEHALPVLRRHGFGALVFAVSGMLGAPNQWDSHAPGQELPRLMGAEELRTWAADGIEFGAHGRTHRELTRLPPDELAAEVRGARDDLEEVLDRPVTSFAYPFDRHDEAARELVAATYELAFTARVGLNGLATPADLQRRTSPSPADTVVDIEWRALTGAPLLPRARDALRVRSRAAALGRSVRGSAPPSRA
jgi:GT2 family glycosyltransferase/peptidoglycan/xylan/chitin deacetylase (PgdA/CDA1 family)